MLRETIPTTSTIKATTRINQSSLLTKIPPPTAAAIRMTKSNASSSDMRALFPTRLALKPTDAAPSLQLPTLRSLAAKEGEIESRTTATVSVVKSLWGSVQGDPVFMRRANGWLTIFWVVMIPVSIATGWVKSIVYVSALSLWALVSGHWAAWQAARVEVNQAEEAEARAQENIAADVVDEMITRTDVQPAENSP